MKRRHWELLLKIVVSAAFLYFVLTKVDYKPVGLALAQANVLLVGAAMLLVLLVTVLLAARWFYLVRKHLPELNRPFLRIWQLTVVGMFFNLFLPTGAGGDVVKIFYLAKGSDRKLLLGSSVVVDRLVGALTVITMGAIAILFSRNLGPRETLTVDLLFLMLCAVFAFLSSRRLAGAIYRLGGRWLPAKLEGKLKHVYNSFNFYCSDPRVFWSAVAVSFAMGIVSIGYQYLLAGAVSGGLPIGMSPRLFFVYIPLIWLTAMIPSLGGLGVRELSYVFFFGPHLGKDNAFALSLLVLAGILLQSAVGAIVFLTLKVSAREKK